MISYRDLCGEVFPGGDSLKGWKGINYANNGSSWLAIYVEQEGDWQRVLSMNVGKFSLKTHVRGAAREFESLVVSVTLGNEGCRNIADDTRPWPRDPCPFDTLVKWDGVKFTYRPARAARTVRHWFDFTIEAGLREGTATGARQTY
jgi:hypothetical protein